jgi:hypothetical protein
MGKKDTFKVGDYVFARIYGYRPWPAKIISLNKTSYTVFFYGTRDCGKSIKSKDLWQYKDNKERFSKSNGLKKEFEKSILEIENAISGNDVCSDVENILNDLNTSSVDLSRTDQKNEEMEDGDISTETSALESSKASAPEEENPDDNKLSRTRSGRKNKRLLESDTSNGHEIAKKKQNFNKKSKENPKPVAVLVNENIKTVNSSSPVNSFDMQKKEVLITEVKMIEIELNIKSCLNLQNSDTKMCLRLLKSLNDLLPSRSEAFEIQEVIDQKYYLLPEITQMMLKKNPRCLETIKQLTRYLFIK